MEQQVDRVVPLDVGVVADPGVSGAVLLRDDHRTYLTFRSCARSVTEGAGPTAIVTFERCLITKFGYPNDEALDGHPLSARGLAAYGVFEVLDSSWARSVVIQNRVRFPATPDDYAGRHFVFAFHDSTFECLARDLRVEFAEGPAAEIIQRLAATLDGGD